MFGTVIDRIIAPDAGGYMAPAATNKSPSSARVHIMRAGAWRASLRSRSKALATTIKGFEDDMPHGYALRARMQEPCDFLRGGGIAGCVDGGSQKARLPQYCHIFALLPAQSSAILILPSEATRRERNSPPCSDHAGSVLFSLQELGASPIS